MNFYSRKVLFIVGLIISLSLSLTPILGENPAYAASNGDDVQAAIFHAIKYLRTQLNDDGGLRWVDENSSLPVTIRVVLALATAGYSQDVLVSSQGNRPIDFLAAQGHGWVFQTDQDEPELNLARTGQLLTAVAAANQDPFAFGNEKINLVHLIKTHYDPNTGIFGNATPDNVIDQVWAILGLAASYSTVPQESVEWLISAQATDGSWNDGYGSYLDTTPMALMALVASGFRAADSPEVVLAIDFIMANQEPYGGWQTDWDTTTNANTTGMILQAILAAGQNPTETVWEKEQGTPLSALLNLQSEDGAIGGDFTNAFSTADGILGLSGQPLYDLGHLRRIGRGFEYIFAQQGEDGGWGSAGQTIDVIIAAQVAGWDPVTIMSAGKSPLTYLIDNLDAYIVSGPDAIGKTIIGLVAAGQDPANFNGVDLVDSLMKTYLPEAKAFGASDNTWHQALAILGLRAANAVIPEGVSQTLVDLQQTDGGWEYSPGFGTWPDNTSLAIQALLAAGYGVDEDVVQKGLAYVQTHQLEDAGWGDSSTTAFTIMALNSLGIDPDDWQRDTGKTPISALHAYQNPSGAFMFSEEFPDENLMATSAALLAAVGGDYLVEMAEQTASKSAGLVVETDLGNVTTACVTIEDESISGLALLDASGIPYELQEGFMNSIMDRSNPPGGTMYWSYWHWDGRDWVFNTTGIGDSVVLPGGIEAWFFTSWELFPSPPPDFVPHFSRICDQPLLKNHATQPYLHYYDLNDVPMIETDFVRMAEVSPASDKAEEKVSILPIVIIGVVGLFVMVLIFVILSRRK